ncbi:DUF6301 family protein [Nocardia sp. NPDC058666]|uniref:DUF6301 family protein n=1 Tax=unclassified Nocardia TaxID=2637762 RepID=UPI0036511B0D
MQGDIEGAVRVAKIARSFEWTWAQRDLERFCAENSWVYPDQGADGASFLVTNLRVNIKKANVFCNRQYIRGPSGRDESLERITVYVTDISRVKNKTVAASLSECMNSMVAELTIEFGEPTIVDLEPKRIRWIDHDCVISLLQRGTYILLEILNPRYWMEVQDLDAE